MTVFLLRLWGWLLGLCVRGVLARARWELWQDLRVQVIANQAEVLRRLRTAGYPPAGDAIVVMVGEAKDATRFLSAVLWAAEEATQGLTGRADQEVRDDLAAGRRKDRGLRWQ